MFVAKKLSYCCLSDQYKRDAPSYKTGVFLLVGKYFGFIFNVGVFSNFKIIIEVFSNLRESFCGLGKYDPKDLIA